MGETEGAYKILFNYGFLFISRYILKLINVKKNPQSYNRKAIKLFIKE